MLSQRGVSYETHGALSIAVTLNPGVRPAPCFSHGCVINTGLSTPAIHVITSQGFSVLLCPVLLCLPFAIQDYSPQSTEDSHVSSFHWPYSVSPPSFLCLLSLSILSFHAIWVRTSCASLWCFQSALPLKQICTSKHYYIIIIIFLSYYSHLSQISVTSFLRPLPSCNCITFFLSSLHLPSAAGVYPLFHAGFSLVCQLSIMPL